MVYTDSCQVTWQSPGTDMERLAASVGAQRSEAFAFLFGLRQPYKTMGKLWKKLQKHEKTMEQ